MSGRPYFNHSIIELEVVAVENWENASILKSISHELIYRTTRKARSLQQQIQQRIETLAETRRGLCDIEQYEIVLPPQWFKGVHLDRALIQVGSPYNDSCKRVMFHFPEGSNLILEAGIRILSIANQLSADGKEVIFTFDDTNVFNYLNRMEFFFRLDPRIVVLPYRPDYSPKGRAESLVEIGEIVPGKNLGSLPGELADTFCTLAKVKSSSALGVAAFTVFAEMIGNVQEHSETVLSGYAALQVYRPRRHRSYIQVVVSDSGKGIVNTLRPEISRSYSEYEKLPDSEIIKKMFEMGLSRFGPAEGRGEGLKRSWRQAMKTDSRLVIRQGTCSVTLRHGRLVADSNVHNSLAPIRGSHISLEFYLD